MDEVLFRSAEPVKIKIERGQRATYGWEIAVKGDNPDLILSQIVAIDEKLKILYSPPDSKVKADESNVGKS